ncbi:MAG: hypothetical protein OEY24_06660 [Candidatus Bathyarchaeota archaeon]|nr:hypothetical protein [Candidatus Bathyarchaeota archaeon]MDH5495365.1 hypothetical protein [Candidatus Bathyarchaeota archaeon]
MCKKEAKAFFGIYIITVVIIASACIYISAYARESLVFVSCEFNDRYDFINMEVKNTGNTNMKIVDLQINHVSLWDNPNGSITVDAGKTQSLGVMYNWSSGHSYSLTIVTAHGNTFSLLETALQRELPLEIEDIFWDSTENKTTIVVKNIGTRERKIIGLELTDALPMYCMVTSYTNIDIGKLVPVNQTATIVLNSSNHFPLAWTNGETYYFSITPETGPFTIFTSEATT